MSRSNIFQLQKEAEDFRFKLAEAVNDDDIDIYELRNYAFKFANIVDLINDFPHIPYYMQPPEPPENKPWP